MRKQVRWEELAAGRKAEQRLRENRDTKSTAEKKSDTRVQVPPKNPKGRSEERGSKKINRKKANC